MQKERILILDQQTINWKLQRMAYQIWEHNSKEQEIILIGIEGGGMAVAKSIADRLKEISPLKVELISLKLDKKQPLSNPATIDRDLNGKSIVLVDDVANSGKTIMYALKPLLVYEPARILMTVLVDRKHKAFPVS